MWIGLGSSSYTVLLGLLVPSWITSHNLFSWLVLSFLDVTIGNSSRIPRSEDKDNNLNVSSRSNDGLIMSRHSMDDLSATQKSRKSMQSSGKSEYEDEYIVPMNVVDMTHGVGNNFIFWFTTLPAITLFVFCYLTVGFFWFELTNHTHTHTHTHIYIYQVQYNIGRTKSTR